MKISFSFLRVVLAGAFFFVSVGSISMQNSSKQNELDALLKKTLKGGFQKKKIEEIYLSGPNKTHNACFAST